ncbi:MAG: DUF1080 domain-containing protein [Planctomycetaceae bacterium]|nr:DUF1080 domain-containing protein [Planctomycetaceae bacterium]
MKKILGLFLCVSMFAAVSFAAEPNTLTDKEKAEGFILLFDGNELSTDLWAGDIKGYPVSDGIVKCSKGGNVSTKEMFENFIFRFEFKLPPGGNNGIGFRLPTPTAGGASAGFECQILDHDDKMYSTGSFKNGLAPYQYHASIYFIIPAQKRDALKPVGEWNTMELTNIGSKVKVLTNDVVVLEANLDDYKDKPKEELLGKHRPGGLDRKDGHIGFQGHSDPVWFRTIRIKKLPAE